MMFKKFSIIAPLVFFLLGIHVFAQADLKTSYPDKNTAIAGNQHISAYKAEIHPAVAAKNIADKKQGPSSSNGMTMTAAYIVSIIVGGLLLIGLVYYWFIFKRRISRKSQRL